MTAKLTFVGKMIDGSKFAEEADRDLVIEALKLELEGNDIATDDFLADVKRFSISTGIAVKAMCFESEDYIKCAIELLENGHRFAVKGLVTEYGVAPDIKEAMNALANEEF